MNGFWAAAMLISGGLFAGGVASLAWERLPAWRGADIAEFRVAFAHTLRRVDRLQPALLVICLVSTIGFVVSADGTARTSALAAAGSLVVVLVGSLAWLVPIQRRLASSTPDLSPREAERLRDRWLRGHVLRTVVAVLALVLVVVAATS